MNAITYRATWREKSRLRKYITALRNNCGAIVFLAGLVALLAMTGEMP